MCHGLNAIKTAPSVLFATSLHKLQPGTVNPFNVDPNKTQPVASLFLLCTIVVITMLMHSFLIVLLKFIQLFGSPATSVQ